MFTLIRSCFITPTVIKSVSRVAATETLRGMTLSVMPKIERNFEEQENCEGCAGKWMWERGVINLFQDGFGLSGGWCDFNSLKIFKILQIGIISVL